jgi:hypothetical protein
MSTAITKITRNLTLSAASLLLLGLSACAELEQGGRAPGEEVIVEPTVLGELEQATFSGNLGSALGNPVAMGNTTGLTDEFLPTCSFELSAAPEAAFIWRAPSAGTYSFSTKGSGFDTMLEIFDLTGESIGCNNNDESEFGTHSKLTLELTANQQLLITLDGWRDNQGAYKLAITRL